MDLAPFTPYMSKPTPDSRREIMRQILDHSEVMTDLIVDGLLHIVAVEGPILSHRAYTLYSKKAGMAKLSAAAVKRFSAALKKAKAEGKILMERDPSAEGVHVLLWLPTMKRVVPREYGNRGFDDIPASELGEVMFEVAADVGEEKEALYHAMMELYGLSHLPKSATARLDFIYKEYLG